MSDKKKRGGDFLREFFDKKGKLPEAVKRESKFTIEHDTWDDKDYAKIHKEVREFQVAEGQLSKIADTDQTKLAAPAMADEFWSLVKAMPELKEEKEIRPSHKINAAVMAEQMEMKAYEALRAHSVGDPIGTALSSVTMEPHLEVIYDKLKKERELAEELESKLREYEDLEDELHDVEKMWREALEEAGETPEDEDEGDGDGDEDGDGDGDGEGQGQGQGQPGGKGGQPGKGQGQPGQGQGQGKGQGKKQGPQDYQKQAAQIQDQLEELRKSIEEGNDELDERLGKESSMIRQQLAKALSAAQQEAELSESLSMAWGLEQGGLKKLDPQQRLELAKKMNNEKFRRLAELIGPMMRLAWAEQQKKVNNVPEEAFDVQLSGDINHMLAGEYVNLHHPILRMDWMRRFVESKLTTYRLRGVEKVAKGGIIFCEDGSGSMSGQPEVWAKAVGLALLHIAKSQKRPFTGIHFGGPREIKTFEFETTGKEFKSHTTYNGKTEDLVGVEAVVDFASIFFGGGTDFMTPLSRALDQLRLEHEKYGAVKGDIVFITDGICGVSEEWLKNFKEEQARLGFKVFGVVVGYGNKDSEPLTTICDGRVAEIKDLVSGEGVRHIFNAV